MIKNDLQYRLAKSALKRFQSTLDRHKKLTANQKPWIRKLHKSTIISEVQQIEADIKEYEHLKASGATIPQLNVVSQIPSMLIKRRIALGWTQGDLAKRLGVRPQQVQNDEATNYASANLLRLTRTAEILQTAKSQPT